MNNPCMLLKNIFDVLIMNLDEVPRIQFDVKEFKWSNPMCNLLWCSTAEHITYILNYAYIQGVQKNPKTIEITCR